MTRLLPLVLILLAVGRPAAAHELWLEPQAGGDTALIHWGHVAGSGHEGVRSIEYDPTAVIGVRCLAADTGVDVSTDVIAPGAGEPSWPVRVDLCRGVVAVHFDAGTWTKTVRGTRPGGPDEHPDGLGSWRARATVKRIDAWNPRFASPVLDALEITPTGDPFAVEAGGKLNVRVTLTGEPVEGAVVTYDGKPRGTTGPDGVVRIRLRDAGTQHVGAILEVDHAGAPIARTVHEAFLVFDLGGR